MSEDFDRCIDDDEGRDFPDKCSQCDSTGLQVGEPELVRCYDCGAMLCGDHRIDDGDVLYPSYYCRPCFKALPDPDDLPREAYDPDDRRDQGGYPG